MSYDLTYSENITTNEDLLHYKGINLNVDSTNQINDVGDNPAARQINDVEEWLIAYINENFAFDGDRQDLSEYQKKYFIKAVCEQIDYILDNGDVRGMAGLNAETGVVIDSKMIASKELAPSAYKCLRMCGLANLRRG